MLRVFVCVKAKSIGFCLETKVSRCNAVLTHTLFQAFMVNYGVSYPFNGLSKLTSGFLLKDSRMPPFTELLKGLPLSSASA